MCCFIDHFENIWPSTATAVWEFENLLDKKFFLVWLSFLSPQQQHWRLPSFGPQKWYFMSFLFDDGKLWTLKENHPTCVRLFLNSIKFDRKFIIPFSLCALWKLYLSHFLHILLKQFTFSQHQRFFGLASVFFCQTNSEQFYFTRKLCFTFFLSELLV